MIPELTEIEVKEMEIELLRERLRCSDLKNKELTEQLRLHGVGSAFYCQADIEGQRICDIQCDHCQEYYKPLEQ